MKKDYKPWESHPDVWKTQSAYYSFIRGGIRRGLWMRNPIRIKYLNSVKRKIKNPSTRKGAKSEIFGATCEMCNGEKPIAQIEIDHKDGNHSLKELSDISDFITSIVLVDTDDLQALCKDCHSIKSYADAKGITLAESEAIKQAIAIVKTKKDKEWLSDRGIMPLGNQLKRRAQIEEYLLAELNKDKQ